MIELLKNRHFGETAIIVCNGPSLNEMNLSQLKNLNVIGLNKIYLGFNKFNFYPNYYVAVNRNVLIQSQNEIKNLSCIKFLSNRLLDTFSSGPLTYLLDTSSPKNRFSTDLKNGLHEGWTVTYAALQIAYYLGFSKVVIIGMDHRYTYSGNPNEQHYLDGKDPNHFCHSYFENNSWDNPDLVKSEESYKIARQVFENDGRKIIDSTVNGACDIFEKQPWLY